APRGGAGGCRRRGGGRRGGGVGTAVERPRLRPRRCCGGKEALFGVGTKCERGPSWQTGSRSTRLQRRQDRRRLRSRRWRASLLGTGEDRSDVALLRTPARRPG